MGTNEEISKLQQEIKSALKQAGLNKSQFAAKYFDDVAAIENEADLKTFKNTLNSQLRRTRKSEKTLNQLKQYLAFIYVLPEFKKSGLAPPRNVPHPELDEKFRQNMARISKSIDQAMEENASAKEEAEDDS